MDTLNELIQHHHLEDDGEFVIVPLPKREGGVRRCFLLKRRFMRIVFPSGNYVDYPLETVIEATMRYPELPLSEALPLLVGEAGVRTTVVQASPVQDDTASEKGADSTSG